MSIIRVVVRVLAVVVVLHASSTRLAVAQESDSSTKPPIWALNYQEVEASTLANIEQLVLHADQIVGIELWVAAGTGKQIESRFGHSLLRFVMKPRPGSGRNSWFEDPVLGFVADISPKESKWNTIKKGVSGSYAARAVVFPMSYFWESYVRYQGREIERSIVVSNPAMRRQLADELRRWADETQGEQKYRFFTENCASLLVRLLGRAGFTSVGRAPIRPSEVPDHLRRSLYVPYPTLTIPSVVDLYQRSQAALELKAIEFSSGQNWPDNAASRLRASLTPIERVRLIQEVVLMPEFVRRELLLTLDEDLLLHSEQTLGPVSLGRILGIRPIPAELYEICESLECGEAVTALSTEIWEPAVLQKNRSELEQIYARRFRNTRAWTVPIPAAVRLHYKFAKGYASQLR